MQDRGKQVEFDSELRSNLPYTVHFKADLGNTTCLLTDKDHRLTRQRTAVNQPEARK